MIKYIGFDKDGTLLDTLGIYTKSWGEIIHSDFGIAIQEAEDEFKKTAGEATFVQLSKLLRVHNINLSKEEIFNKASEMQLKLGEAGRKALLFPDVLEAIRILKSQNYSIFVSSGQQEIITKEDLERTKLIEYIDFYAGIKPDQPDYKKGEPHFRAAANHFGVPFETFINESMFVGDTPTDMELASQSNIISIGRVGTFNSEDLFEEGAKFVIKDISEIYNILQKYNTTVGS